MALFFNILPTDLQFEVIQTWIGSHSHDCCNEVLETLSALDVACCSRALRSPLLYLTSHISFGSVGINSTRSGPPFKAVQWLADRRLAVKVLELDSGMMAKEEDRGESDGQLHCPSVERFILTSYSSSHPRWFHTLLTACPNLTSITCSDMFGSHETLFSTIPQHSFSKLQCLSIEHVWTVREAALTQCLQAVGGQLTELRLLTEDPLSAELVGVIGQLCPNLVVLEANMLEVPVADVITSLEQCHALEQLEIVLAPAISILDMESLVTACKQLKALYLDCGVHMQRAYPSCTELAGLLERCPRLERINLVQYLSYCRRTGCLTVEAHRCGDAAFDGIFSMCPVVTQLHILGDCKGPTNKERVFRLLQTYQSTLVDVRILCFGGVKAFSAALQCPSLKVLHCKLYLDFDPPKANELTINCKKLETLVLHSPVEGCLTDDIVEAIFGCCPLLQEMDLRLSAKMTKRTVQAVADNKLHLKTFTSNVAVSVSAGVLLELPMLMRELQILPVPRVIIA